MLRMPTRRAIVVGSAGSVAPDGEVRPQGFCTAAAEAEVRQRRDRLVVVVPFRAVFVVIFGSHACRNVWVWMEATLMCWSMCGTALAMPLAGCVAERCQRRGVCFYVELASCMP